ncbi:MAG: tetratricopeptide repeat protein [Elusimicrobiota bacterium]
MFLLFRYFYFGKIGDLEASNLPSPLLYFINQVYIVLKYVWLLLVPIGLCIDRGSYTPVKSIYEFKFLISGVIIIGIFIFTLLIFKRKNNILKILLFSILLFFITLSPTSSILPATSVMVDNRLYISGFGFYLILIYFYLGIISRLKYKWLPVVPVFYFLFLGITTYKRNQVFQQPVLLWEEVITKYPHSRAYYNVGIFYLRQKEYNKAYQFLQKAIEMDPNSKYAYNALGTLYCDQKNYNKAIQLYQTSIKIDPDYALAHYNLGVVYHKQKKYNKAIEKYQEAIKLNPTFEKAYSNLGVLYYTQKKYNNALEQLKIALDLFPDDQQAKKAINIIKSLKISE